MRRQNPLLEDERFAERAERVGIWASIVILCIGMILIILFLAEPKPPVSQGMVPVHIQTKIATYCAAHKVHPDVVEINPNGRMFYWLDNGKRAEIK